MIRSALLRRVYALVILALVITAVSTWLLFLLTSNSLFVNIRAKEMMPRAQSLASVVDGYLSGTFEEDLLLSLVDVSEEGSSIMNAYLIVANRGGQIVLTSDINRQISPESLKDVVAEALNGRNTIRILKSAGNADIFMLGLPVYAANGTISGAQLLYMPLYETLAARGALAGALATSMGIVVPVVFVALYALLYRIVTPLRQMRDVALRMADGNFDRLANEEISGEIGQLGASLNRLSRELKRTISALTLERNRLVQILNGLTEGIAAVDQLGNMTHINPALENLFPGDKLTADPRMRVIPRAEVWQAFDAAVNLGESADFSIREGEKDIRCVISPVRDESAKIAGAVGLFRDISKEVRLENTRREYVANVSHEMRTPLTAMRGLIEPLRDGLVTDENAQKRYYDIILREILRLSRLINDLMELSRLQSGTLAIQPERFEIGELIEDLADRYTSTAAEHGLKLSLNTDFSACPALYANPDRVEQLLVILLDNAIKYTPEGGEISVSGEWNDERVTLRVRDTGMGISPENLEHVFERFYKVDKAHTGMGSGLGLSIAKEMLKQMGENIWVTSELGKGSEFSFTVKIANRFQEAEDG